MLWVNGHQYKIIFQKNLENDNGNLGSCCLRKDEIRIDDSLSESYKEDVLFHEIFEAIVGLNGIAMDHGVLTILAQNFYSVFKTNNLIVKDILKKV